MTPTAMLRSAAEIAVAESSASSRIGYDPAQSSSVDLMTVTDVVGSFGILRIATVPAGIL